MTRLIDTSLRILGQEPLAGRMLVGKKLETASVLDRAGFHALEVSGGGCFRAAMIRAVDSPWERIRAYKARTRSTPLAMALRGSFLTGSVPASDDLVRRFVLSAADSGIEIFRLHDPLNDVSRLEVAARAVREAGARLYGSIVYNEFPGSDATHSELARRLAEMGADRVLLADPSGVLSPGRVAEEIRALRAAAGVPVGLFCQGSAGTALAVAIEAARAGADVVGVASYPVAVATHRPAAEILAATLEGTEADTGLDLGVAWEAAGQIDGGLVGDSNIPPLSPHVSMLAADARVNAGMVSNLERRLHALGADDRIREVIDELLRIRQEIGTPPTAAPIGTIMADQAIDHVLSGRRWTGMSGRMRSFVLREWGTPPQSVDEDVVAVARTTAAPEPEEPDLSEARAKAAGLAASDEELCLVALYGDEARPLLENLRHRHAPRPIESSSSEETRVQRLIGLLEESSDVAEIVVEEGGTKITVRRQEDRPPVQLVAPPVVPTSPSAPDEPPAASGAELIPSPMVGTFYRSPGPDEPSFVEEGTEIEPGQTIAILEAMKLFNEMKAERAGTITKILVGNGEAVEYGQTLFEFEPA